MAVTVAGTEVVMEGKHEAQAPNLIGKSMNDYRDVARKKLLPEGITEYPAHPITRIIVVNMNALIMTWMLYNSKHNMFAFPIELYARHLMICMWVAYWQYCRGLCFMTRL